MTAGVRREGAGPSKPDVLDRGAPDPANGSCPLPGNWRAFVVFVLSSDRQPLDPTSSARARKLLKAGRAAIFRRYPFTIRLKDRTAAESVTHAHRLKLDPGSKTTGLAIIAEASERVVWAAELTHRAQAIRDALLTRHAIRRSRRQRHTRYRKARYDNRRRPANWLAPSLAHRVLTTLTWVQRLCKVCPIAAISLELVRFDTQLMQDAEISGVAYQQGELAGYEFNRTRLELAKSHWADAACVGASTSEQLDASVASVLLIAAKGHGRRQMCRTDKYGFPRRHVPRQKRWFGYKTGDLVRAVVRSGKYQGVHVGRVAIRASGSFNISTERGLIQGIGHRHCRIIQRADGYAYAMRKEERASSPAKAGGLRARF